MVGQGKRYLAWEWGGGDDVFANPRDVCNTPGDNIVSINPAGPGG